MTELTAEDLERSEHAQKFENVRPVDLFSKTASTALAMKVLTANPVRYRQLRDEWLVESGIVPYPDSHWG